MKIQFLGSHTITLQVIQASSTQKPEKPWKTWQPSPETNPARSLPRLCPSVTTMSKHCCPVKKTPNAQFDTRVQLLQSQPPMQMSDCLRSTQQQPTVPAIRQRPECRKLNVSFLLTREFGKISQCPDLLHLMDGTFSVPPHPFKQLYTIRVPFKDVTGTAVYAFLPNKCRDTYRELFQSIV